ncbi:hypothetical protein D9757_002478 [Collybiopsis confluens]|uniref:Uncharacterized protein n=1 Tax=Collybiopsis confluens TaxID=2823264 RepID=A0A8H5MEX6_9AGAR|nr:hypothetical protein D9757_002478 [Collybiopsis confluens]
MAVIMTSHPHPPSPLDDPSQHFRVYASRARTRSISSPRFHVTNPTEPDPPTTMRPLPAPTNRTHPCIHINTSTTTTKHMPKPSLPIGPASPPTPDPTPVSPSTLPRTAVRPLPPPPPKAPIPGPRNRSSSRGPSTTPRSRTNSAVGRGDTLSRPQLAFDPTSSSYVIKTPSEVGFDKTSRNVRPNNHARSRSAQFKNFSSMVLPPTTSSSSSPSYPTAQRASTGTAKWKGKQPVRSAPSSDTEDFLPLRSSAPSSESRQSRRLVLHNPTEPPTSIRSAPVSDDEHEEEEDGYLSSPSSSVLSTSTALTSPLLLPPTGSIKDILPQFIRANDTHLIQPQPITSSTIAFKSPFIPTRIIEPLHIIRHTPPPGGVSRIVSPLPLPPLSEDIGYAEQGYVDDDRVYADDGYEGDGPAGLGAFSTSVDPDVDLDIGKIVFSNRPPSGEFMGPSVMDLDMEGRGRHVERREEDNGYSGSRTSLSMRWRSADADTEVARGGISLSTETRRDTKTKSPSPSTNRNTVVGPRRSPRSSSHGQSVIMSSFQTSMLSVPAVPQVELGPTPIDMDFEPEMVFSKNPASVTPVETDTNLPGVLDFGERMYGYGKGHHQHQYQQKKWSLPSPKSVSRPSLPPLPTTTKGKDPTMIKMKERETGVQRFSTMPAQFAPVRSKGFYENW